jgi:hypothetical protein
MTKDKAIENIKLLMEIDSYPKDFADALIMAIEALENKPTTCEKCIHVKSCRKVIILKNGTYKLIKYCSQGAERRNP